MRSTLAIVVTHNRCAMLAGCLKALKAQTVPCGILVVDNASTDDTWAIVQPFLNETCRCVRLPKNVGGAGGFAYGLRWGVAHGYDTLWVMDDDVLPEKTALEALRRAEIVLDGNYGFLSSVVLWTDGTVCRMNRQAVSQQYGTYLPLLEEGLLAIKQATFVSCFFSRETVIRYGLPIGEFFLWGDDIEYTRRLAVREGLACYLVGKSRVVHRMASNLGSDIARESGDRLGRFYYAYRNENYLYRREGASGIVYYLARCGRHLLGIWQRGENRRLLRSGILLAGFLAGCFFYPKVTYISEDEQTQCNTTI